MSVPELGKPIRVDPAAVRILDAARELLDSGLWGGGSAFNPGGPVWSRAAADELYDAFVALPDLSSGLDFMSKLHKQIAGCSDEAVQLAAELLTLNVLPLSNVNPATKRTRITTVLSWMDKPVDLPRQFHDAFAGGVFNGGVGFNVQIWQLFSFLIQLVRYWRELPADERRSAEEDPWQWKRIVFAAPGPNTPAQRQALLYLAFPETFLPIVSSPHKRAIRDTFVADFGLNIGDLDRDLMAITVALQADVEGPVEYYRPPLMERWRPAAVDEKPGSRRAWLVRGSSVNGYNVVGEWLRDGFVSLSAANLRRLDPNVDQAHLKEAVDEDYSHKSYAARQEKVHELHAFLSRMSDGDLVATTTGGLLHVGVITGSPTFTDSRNNRSNLRRPMRWSTVDAPVDYAELPAPLTAKLSSQSDVVDLTEERALLEALLGGQPVIEEAVELVLRDADGALAERLLTDRAWLQESIDLLRDRRQLIFYGPPGTGKTYVAQHLAWHLTDRSAVKLVQFHPSYSYEDFFEGFRPTLGTDGTMGFQLKPGPFRRIVDAARQNPSTPHVLIIDEINRANLAKVFGELYFLLEYRDQAVGLLYSAGEEDDFTLPENVFVIGTMNTADRSIALVDTAMRRRFAFVSLHPADEPVRGLLGRWLAQQGLPGHAAALLDALNARVPDAEFAIGPSYFMRPSVYTDGGLDRVWRTSILPLLEELHYDDGVDVAARYGLPALRRSLPAPAVGDPQSAAVLASTPVTVNAESGAQQILPADRTVDEQRHEAYVARGALAAITAAESRAAGGTATCRACHETKLINKFPTTTRGADNVMGRGDECRSCRDDRRSAERLPAAEPDGGRLSNGAPPS